MYHTTRAWRLAAAAVTAGALAAMSLAVTPASAAPSQQGCEDRNNNTYAKLLECVRVEGVREHQAAFQAIADANDGNRAAGTQGYVDSVEYVAERLEAAGWNVSFDEFPFTYIAPAELQQLTPVVADYETGAYTGSGAGDVTASVVGVDLALGSPASSSSGCEAADFAGFPAGSIALIQRGTCTFAIKALNAEAAGAVGVVIFNQGTAGRLDLIIGTLGGTGVTGIPVVGASFDQGVALAQPGSTARIFVAEPEQRPQLNVIAELPGRNDDNIVMAGAHLDSVQRGPGINDNGSGSAALIELAEQLSNHTPQNTIRLAWWGAEEAGLIGSTQYVDALSDDELAEIALYLNFDMIGSPNYYLGVYDADQSSFVAPVPVPDGSAAIEDTFESFYTFRGEPYDDSAFSGRSDYQAFINNGIPAGGLFTGAEVIKTPEQADIWGGTAGDQFDPCYHLASRHVRQQQPAGARGQLRCRGIRSAHVRLLHRERERCCRQEGPR